MTNPAARAPSNDDGNIGHVKALYQALADRDLSAARDLLVDQPVWDITPGAPDGGVYRGMAAVFGDFYPRLAARFHGFEVRPDTYLDGGDTVLAAGSYAVTRCTGDHVELVRFAHVFGIAPGGRITGVWQVADTALLAA